MIDEDHVLLVASINIATINLKVVLKAKNDERFYLKVKIRNVWIPKQYMVHRDELAVKRIMFTAKE